MEGGSMSGWSGGLPLPEGLIGNGLAVIYAVTCVALLLCQVFDRPRMWLRSRLPRRWIPDSKEDPIYAAWVDLVLSAGGLAVIAWVMDAPVAALGMLAVAVFALVALSVTGRK